MYPLYSYIMFIEPRNVIIFKSTRIFYMTIQSINFTKCHDTRIIWWVNQWSILIQNSQSQRKIKFLSRIWCVYNFLVYYNVLLYLNTTRDVIVLKCICIYMHIVFDYYTTPAFVNMPIIDNFCCGTRCGCAYVWRKRCSAAVYDIIL